MTYPLSLPHARNQSADVSAARDRFAALHGFLLEHAFYPLMLCTLLCFAFWFTRVSYARTFTYSFLVKNLFLAWVPYFFSLAAVAMRRSAKPRAAWTVALVWFGWLVML